jgi:hypothetical protein
MEKAERIQRLIYREFLSTAELYRECGLDGLPHALATLLKTDASTAIDQLLTDPLLDRLELPQLNKSLAIRDMALVSQTAASVASELKAAHIDYDACCRRALAYAVLGMTAHVFSALRCAAAKNDQWAQHHYLYGLLLGLEGNHERALWELDMALEREPYEEGRRRVRLLIDLLSRK